MARMFGFIGNRSDLGARVLELNADVLRVAQPGDQSLGWGIGFYQSGEVLLRRRPLDEREVIDLAEAAGNVRTDVLIGHVRRASVGSLRTENTHPFRYRMWLFAQTGTIGGFERLRERLLASQPEFLRRNVRGDTDSEHFFHAILAFLHDAGQLDSVDVDAKPVLSAVRSAVALVDRLGAEVGAEPPTLNMILTNGRLMFALRRGAPLMHVERHGLHDTRESSEEPVEPKAPSVLRYVRAVSDGPDVPRDYGQIEDRQVLVIDRNLNVGAHSL